MTPKRILIVDDDHVVRLVIGQGLRTHGYEVLEAETGEEALELCETETLDLAIVDYKMPEMDGLKVAEAFRDVYGLPFLFLSAYHDDAIVRQAVAQGAHSYLVKPVGISALLPQVEAALERTAEAKHLNRALTETQLINVATGILMSELRVPREQAFEHLRSVSQLRRQKVQALAVQIVQTFETSLDARSPFDALITCQDTGENKPKDD